MKTADIGAALTGTQFLISMVESRMRSRNGDAAADTTAPQELQRIEQQIGRLESLDGQSADTRRQIEDLRERVEALDGKVRISSQPDKGTTIEAEIPVGVLV